MALSLPTPQQLQSHREGVDDAEALQRASDLFRLATGVEDDPTDPFEARLLRLALLDMAWSLQTIHDDMEEKFSPFSGERIGSYSYNKMQTAVNSREATGVPGFDSAVAYFLARDGGLLSVSSEWVFTQGYGNENLPERNTSPDPSTGASRWTSPAPPFEKPPTGSIVFDDEGFPLIAGNQ